MSSASAIEWTDATWNPVTGCDRVSPGCAHCYALELAPRLRAMGVQRYVEARDGGRSSGPAFGVTLHEEVLDQPRHWRKPRRVFVNSMSDLFHEEVPSDFIAQVLDVIAECEQHTFQILTKRPERIFDFFQDESAGEGWYAFPDNAWVGVSIENRRFVYRADMLRDVPATVRFISAEPLLGPLVNELGFPERGGRAWRWDDGYIGPSLSLEGGIDWLIVGGESGHEHRPMNLDWVRELRDAAVDEKCGLCMGSGKAPIAYDRTCWRCGGDGRQTRFFFKQVGGATPKAGGRELDGRTWDEFPPALGRALALTGAQA